MDTKNLYGTTFPTNPFSTQSKSNNSNLNDLYARLEALKAQQAVLDNSLNTLQSQPQQQANVFTDIASELKDLSEDELNFIKSQKEYQIYYNKYQTEFSEFLTSKFANEFLQTNNSRSLEELLKSIRNGKEAYKSKFTKDINEIRETNKELLEKNNKLVIDNENLQKQLKDIQEQIWRE